MAEKRKPRYPPLDIKAAFSDPATLNRSFVSPRGADDLDMDDGAVIAVIQSLTFADFDKFMTPYANHAVWRYVNEPIIGGRTPNVKFTLDARRALFL